MQEKARYSRIPMIKQSQISPIPVISLPGYNPVNLAVSSYFRLFFVFQAAFIVKSNRFWDAKYPPILNLSVVNLPENKPTDKAFWTNIITVNPGFNIGIFKVFYGLYNHHFLPLTKSPWMAINSPDVALQP